MKQIIRYISLLFSLAVMFTACSKEQVADEQSQATVTLRLGSRGADLAKDGVENLRVIFVQGGKVLYHDKWEGSSIREEMTFLGVSREETTIYAVANADKVDINNGKLLAGWLDTSIRDGEPLPDNFEKEVLSSPFPKAETNDSEETVPMSAKEIISKEEMQAGQSDIEKTINLLRVVARLDINLINRTSQELDVKNIKFGECLAEETSLFDGQGSEEESCKSDALSANAQIGSNKSHTFTYYLYEGPSDKEKYTIALDAENGPASIETPVCFMENTKDEYKKPVSSIKRNMYVTINATVESSEMPIHLDVSVKDWIDLPLKPNFK